MSRKWDLPYGRAPGFFSNQRFSTSGAISLKGILFIVTYTGGGCYYWLWWTGIRNAEYPALDRTTPHSKKESYL